MQHRDSRKRHGPGIAAEPCLQPPEDVGSAQVQDRHARVTPAGDLLLDFGAADTAVLVIGGAGMEGLADALIIL